MPGATHPEDLKRGDYALILGPREKPEPTPNPYSEGFFSPFSIARITIPVLAPGVPFLIQALHFPFLYVVPVDLQRNSLAVSGVVMVDLRLSRVQKINARSFFRPKKPRRITTIPNAQSLPSVASSTAQPDGARRVSWTPKSL